MQEKTQKVSPIKKRILQFVDTLKISKRDFYKFIDVSRGTLEASSGITEDVLAKFIAKFPEVNINWLITGKGDMLELGKEEYANQKAFEETRPRIPMEAEAGVLSIALEGVKLEHTEQIPLMKAFSKYDFTIFVRGDSMDPEFHSGDELACLYLKSTSFIQWGHYHVLDTPQGVLVKRIFEEDDFILCKSDNSEFYKDFRIPKHAIYNIALVVGCIRRY